MQLDEAVNRSMFGGWIRLAVLAICNKNVHVRSEVVVRAHNVLLA